MSHVGWQRQRARHNNISSSYQLFNQCTTGSFMLLLNGRRRIKRRQWRSCFVVLVSTLSKRLKDLLTSTNKCSFFDEAVIVVWADSGGQVSSTYRKVSVVKMAPEGGNEADKAPSFMSSTIPWKPWRAWPKPGVPIALGEVVQRRWKVVQFTSKFSSRK